MFDIHPVRQFQQPVHQVVGAEEHLDPALPGSLLDETVLRGVGEEEHRDDEDLEAQDAVHRVPDGDGGVPVWVSGQGTYSVPLTVWRSGRSCPRITGRP